MRFLHSLNRWTISLLVAGAFSLSSVRSAHAIDRDLNSIIITSEYGMLAGTVVGCATLPFTQDARAIFIGTSAGLYLGIAVGIYFVLNRNNPDNPLIEHRYRPPRYETPPPQPDQGELKIDHPPSPLALVNVPVLRF